jgi:Fe2+ or Zn2+ uptake regulation protein
MNRAAMLDLFRSLAAAASALELLEASSAPSDRMALAAIRRALETAASEGLAIHRRGPPSEVPDEAAPRG